MSQKDRARILCAEDINFSKLSLEKLVFKKLFKIFVGEGIQFSISKSRVSTHPKRIFLLIGQINYFALLQKF